MRDCLFCNNEKCFGLIVDLFHHILICWSLNEMKKKYQDTKDCKTTKCFKNLWKIWVFISNNFDFVCSLYLLQNVIRYDFRYTSNLLPFPWMTMYVFSWVFVILLIIYVYLFVPYFWVKILNYNYFAHTLNVSLLIHAKYRHIFVFY